MEWIPDGHEDAEWWLTDEFGRAVGPVNAASLLERVRAGSLSADALVCGVGRDRWRRIQDVPELVVSIGAQARRFDPTMERSVFDQESLPPDWDERGHSQALAPPDEVTAVEVPRPASRVPPPLLRVDWSPGVPPAGAAVVERAGTVGVPGGRKSI